jgi:single-stranded-DNA-specific exonuclease
VDGETTDLLAPGAGAYDSGVNERPHPSGAFLGVETSLSGRRWRSRFDSFGDAQAVAIVQRFGLPDALARILVGRRVPLEDIEGFLAPTVRSLMPDPSCLRDLDAAVARLVDAIRRHETVAIFGDYDVDGAASAALLAGMFDACSVPRLIHIPDRILEGYGPNVEAIRALAAQGARLLVCVDCGTTSHEAIDEARRLGLDTIVLDHHLAPEILPDAVVVNPNRADCLSGLGHLCAAGVVFMVLVGLNRALRGNFWSPSRPAPDLMAALDLVALATVADVAPLVGLNRAFVSRGLDVMRRRARPGLAALADVSRLAGPVQAWHLGFLLGPRINAGGRIGDAALGAKLLLETDPIAAAQVAAQLDRLNTERRAIETATVEEAVALALVREAAGGNPAVIVTSGDDWHPGIVGLVASRLKERFGRPAIAIGYSGERGTGSGRSIPGVDLGRAIRAAVEAGHLVKGGGHTMAAGLTVERAQQQALEEFLERRLGEAVVQASADRTLAIDAAVSAGGASLQLLEQIARAGPFGAGNAEPVFALPAHRLHAVQTVGGDHLRLRVVARDGSGLDVMAFRAARTELGVQIDALRGQELHMAVGLSVDHWGSGARVAARFIDAARTSIDSARGETIAAPDRAS